MRSQIEKGFEGEKMTIEYDKMNYNNRCDECGRKGQLFRINNVTLCYKCYFKSSDTIEQFIKHFDLKVMQSVIDKHLIVTCPKRCATQLQTFLEFKNISWWPHYDDPGTFHIKKIEVIK